MANNQQNKFFLNDIEKIQISKLCQIRVGFAGALVLGFGKLIEYNDPKLLGKYHGEWEIRSNPSGGIWRFINKANNKILVGDADTDAPLDAKLIKSLLARNPKITIVDSSSDIKISFPNSITIEILGTSSRKYCWELSGPEHYYEIGPAEKIRRLKKTHINRVSEEEKLLMTHAEDCAARWKKLSPKTFGKQKCRDCVFYRPLEGEFAFFDFGVCSHRQSPFDGKAVHINGHCGKFSKTLKYSMKG